MSLFSVSMKRQVHKPVGRVVCCCQANSRIYVGTKFWSTVLPMVCSDRAFYLNPDVLSGKSPCWLYDPQAWLYS
jgi:hypothetical protein